MTALEHDELIEPKEPLHALAVVAEEFATEPIRAPPENGGGVGVRLAMLGS